MKKLFSRIIQTPISPLLALGDEKDVYFLEFTDSKHSYKHIGKLSKKYVISESVSDPLVSIEEELKAYFAGSLKTFKTPIKMLGTDFQQTTWKALQTIPYGQTISYAELAKKIGKPQAFRAVANANAVNNIAIVIPCHRVIRQSGDLGGYAGGVDIKAGLLALEKPTK